MMAQTKKTCTNKGCGQEYSDEENAEGSCKFHSGPPIFHEGSKGWQCCSKRVMTFDDFLEIPGCTAGRHSDAVEQLPDTNDMGKEKEKSVKINPTVTTGKVETYGNIGATQSRASVVPSVAKPTVAAASKEKKRPAYEQDAEDAQVDVGVRCKRNGCGYAFENQEVSRKEGSAEAVCNFHPGQPIFHEVLEFEEFLKIKGCKEGKHMFVGGVFEKEDGSPASKEDLVDTMPVDDGRAQCRHDWYQTPTHVIVSIYAKNVKADGMQVVFNERQMTVDFCLPDGKKYNMDTGLFEAIDPETSKFKVMGTKVELSLKKANGISWAALEPNENVTSWTTFGLHGTKGTVGGREMHISGDAPLDALNR